MTLKLQYILKWFIMIVSKVHWYISVSLYTSTLGLFLFTVLNNLSNVTQVNIFASAENKLTEWVWQNIVIKFLSYSSSYDDA